MVHIAVEPALVMAKVVEAVPGFQVVAVKVKLSVLVKFHIVPVLFQVVGEKLKLVIAEPQ